MFRKVISLTFVCLLLHATGVVAFAGTTAEKELRRVEKLKAGIVSLGIGKDARIKVRLQDKSKLSGYLAQVNDSCFTVSDLNTGVNTVVAYPSVTQVQGHNLSTGVKIAIGVGIALLVVGIVILIASKQIDNAFGN